MKWIIFAIVLITSNVFADTIKRQVVNPDNIQIYTFDGLLYNNGVTIIVNHEKHFLNYLGADIDGDQLGGLPMDFWNAFKAEFVNTLDQARTDGKQVDVDINRWNLLVLEPFLESPTGAYLSNAQLGIMYADQIIKELK